MVGRSRSVELAKELGPLYSDFINSLDLTLELKNKLIKDLYNNWIPLVMMDKHQPTKIATENVLNRTILCWFYAMQTLGENLNNWNVSRSLRYI